MSRKKTAGKIITALTVLMLIVCTAASWYIGGQTRAVQKYCASIASGNLTDYTAVTGNNSFSDKDEFKTAMRNRLNADGSFADLEENGNIGATARVQGHDIITLDKWQCETKVSYYSGDMTLCFDKDYTVVFKSGKWYVLEDA